MSDSTRTTLVLADLPDQTRELPSLPILARLPDYGKRAAARSIYQPSVEHAVRKWFGQKTALTILVGFGILLAALALAPLVGPTTHEPGPPAVAPNWQPINGQADISQKEETTNTAIQRNQPDAVSPASSMKGSVPTAGVAPGSPTKALNGQDRDDSMGTPASQTVQSIASAASTLGGDLSANRASGAAEISDKRLVRLPPIDRTNSESQGQSPTTPISVEELFAGRPNRRVEDLASANNVNRSARQPTTGGKMRGTIPSSLDSPVERTVAPPNGLVAQARPDSVRMDPRLPLVDRRIVAPDELSEFDTRSTAARQQGNQGGQSGEAVLEGVIEIPSLSAQREASQPLRH